MRRILYIGDPHATPEELGDCRKLIEACAQLAYDHQVDEINLLGDQHHTHGVLRLEVVAFWKWAFRYLRERNPNAEIVVEVGNHDMLADTSSSLHAMICYEGDPIVVIDKPTVRHGVLHMPYYHDREAFVRDCNQFPNVWALVCHQTFDGSKYENGFPAHDGVDPLEIPQTDILSGHIHTQQVVKAHDTEVWYPGTARWRIKSDENVQKAVWIVERDDRGLIRNKLAFDSSKYCRARYRFQLTPDMPLHEAAEADQAIHNLHQDGHLVAVDVEGPSEWVDKQLVELPQGLLVRALRVQNATPRVRESDGIEVSFKRFVDGFQPIHGTAPERLSQLANERFGV